jgi:hypothetical protein
LGEICNFSAYAFQPAIVVAPLGALSVAVSAVLSSWLIKERLSFSGSVGITQCIFGSVLIVLYAPVTNTTQTVDEFFSYVLQPGFLAYSAMCLGLYIYLVYFAAKKYGQSQPAVFISIVAIVGSYLVLSAQGFGSALVYTISNPSDNQFTNWAIYPLMIFVIACAVSQIVFLNKALNCFSPSVVAPINYVFFTTMTIISSAALFRGFNVASVTDGVSMLIGFLVIIGGVSLLFQYSLNLNKLRLLSKIVQDIDDADDAQSIDENPIKILNEDIALARTNSMKSEPSMNRGRIIPDRLINRSSDTFGRRHSLEPVSSSRKDRTESAETFELIRAATTPIPEMQVLSSSKTQILPESSNSSSSSLSKLKSQESVSDPLNQLLVQNSILEIPARFGDMEDSSTDLLDSSKNSAQIRNSKPSEVSIHMDHSSTKEKDSKEEEDWMW